MTSEVFDYILPLNNIFDWNYSFSESGWHEGTQVFMVVSLCTMVITQLIIIRYSRMDHLNHQKAKLNSILTVVFFMQGTIHVYATCSNSTRENAICTKILSKFLLSFYMYSVWRNVPNLGSVRLYISHLNFIQILCWC